MAGEEPGIRRILLCAGASLTVVLGGVSLVVGFSGSPPVRLLQGVAVIGAGAVLLGGAIVLALIHLAAWGEPESEQDFDAIVERAERLAADGLWGDDDAEHDPAQEELFDVTDDEDFRALVRSAVDELPLEFHRALEHVAVVVSDGGDTAGAARGRRRAYGLYQGDTVARDFFHDRIVVFRDTLVRDFGHDPDLLKAQVTRTVRHELAHHLGWGETGVSGLGL